MKTFCPPPDHGPNDGESCFVADRTTTSALRSALETACLPRTGRWNLRWVPALNSLELNTMSTPWFCLSDLLSLPRSLGLGCHARLYTSSLVEHGF